jgi:hypothetical protein
MSRGGRRRRVLNDEVRSASGLAIAAYQAQNADFEAPRYAEQAGVEHHPQVTDFVPRRSRAVLMTLAAGFGVAAGAQTLSHYSSELAAAMPGLPGRNWAAELAGGAVAWVSAMSLAIAALLARLVHSLRRHRVDDYRGAYRIWRWVGWCAVLASVDSVVQLHTLLAQWAVSTTGWTFTSQGSEWWLAPVAAVGIWMLVKLAYEVVESRGTTAVLSLAAACYALAAAGALGWSPGLLGPWSEALAFAMPLAGHTLALAALMIFARYVVLDVQGLIEHPLRPAAAQPPSEPAPGAKTAAIVTATPLAGAPTLAAQRAASTPQVHASASAPNVWADGDDDEEGELSGERRLSKAERKRLRKQQRAA